MSPMPEDRNQGKICSVAVLAIGLVLLVAMALTGCQHEGPEVKAVSGVLEGMVVTDSVSEQVKVAIGKAIESRAYECLLRDEAEDISVWSLTSEATEGWGLVIEKASRLNIFPDIRHSRQPRAQRNPISGDIWLVASAMEGTGVAVERPYLVRFGENDIAYIAATIDPYDMQQALCQRLRYAVEGREVTLYDGDQHLVTVVVNETNMGDLYEDAVWIGEQLTYEADSDGLTVCVTPGLSFNTGLVLLYDDMPTLKARVTLDDDGTFTLGSIKVRSDEEIITEFYRAVLGEKEMTEQMLKESLSPKMLETLWEADYDDTYSWWVFRTGQQDGPSDKSALESIKPLGDGWYRVTYTDMGTRGITDVKMDGGKISDYRTQHSTGIRK